MGMDQCLPNLKSEHELHRAGLSSGSRCSTVLKKPSRRSAQTNSNLSGEQQQSSSRQRLDEAGKALLLLELGVLDDLLCRVVGEVADPLDEGAVVVGHALQGLQSMATQSKTVSHTAGKHRFTGNTGDAYCPAMEWSLPVLLYVNPCIRSLSPARTLQPPPPANSSNSYNGRRTSVCKEDNTEMAGVDSMMS